MKLFLEKAIAADGEPIDFRRDEDVIDKLRSACEASGGAARYETLGRSEAGREIVGFVVGSGPERVSLIAGCHSDEPVGPETLRRLVHTVASRPEMFGELLERFRLCVVCHVNPDGEALNRPWIERWPEVDAYVEKAVRELPGRDVEFAFPDRRAENRAVSDFLKTHAPFVLHASLHGMGFSDGAMLLIDRRWGYRTDALQDRFRALASEAELELHDHNRRGEKGFFYLGPGFNTTPEGEAMRTFFQSRGDDEMASRFGMSSMDFVRSLGGDPLCIVTELPLFVIGRRENAEPGKPRDYLAFKEALTPVRASGDREMLWRLLEEYRVRSLSLETAMRLQLSVLEAGLAAVGSSL